MAYGFLDIAATPSVRAAQERMGSAGMWDHMPNDRTFDRFTEAEGAFIGERDSFYMATVSESGWPYVQHRGGPVGFLKVLDEKTLGFADYRGNRQYISVGNLAADDRAALILVDYPNRARMKIFAHLESIELDADPALTERLAPHGYKARPERLIKIHLVAFDWNCPQHITPRFTQADITQALVPMHERMAALESENAALREQLAWAGVADSVG